MIALLALVSIAVQGTATTNASFHPPSPLVYVEVPDVQKLLASYERAPMVQMARDAAIREVFAKIRGSLGLDIARDLEAALARQAETSGQNGSLYDAIQPLSIEHLAELRSASLSIDLVQASPGELARTVQQISECDEEIARIVLAMGEHRKTHGAWPESAGELGLDPAAITDPWDRPYGFTLEADVPRIVSLGADGKNGGAGADTDTSESFELESWLGSELKRRTSVIVAQECVTPEQASEWSSWLTEGSTLGEPRQVTIRGNPGVFESLHLGSGLPDGWRLRWGNHVVLASEAVSFDAVVARAEGRLGSVESSSLFDPLTKSAGPSQGVDVVRLAVHPAGLSWSTSLFSPELAPAAIAKLLAEMDPGTQRAALRMQLVEQRFVTDFVAFGFAGAWMDTFGKQPVSAGPTSSGAEGLASVPPDAVGALATRLEVAAFRAELVRALGLEEGDELAKLEREHGFDLRKDVLDNLAGGVVAYLMPPVTIGVPNATLAFDLVDPAAFEKGLAGLFTAAAASGAEIKPTKYKSVSLWTFVPDSEPSAVPIQVTPSVAIVGKRALVTTNASWMRKEIKRELEPGDEEATHALARQEKVPADVSVIGSMDWGGTIDGVYKIARSALALGGMIELPFDTGAVNAALPSTAEPFTRFLRPTLGWGRRIEGGIHARIESSFGPETWLSMAALALAAPMWIERTMAEASLAQEPGGDGVRANAADEANVSEVELDETRATLEFLSSRLAVYRIEHKRFPAELAELCKPTASFPRGFVDADSLPVDGWKHAYGYEVTAEGASYRLWSPGRNGTDERGAGDDVVAR